MSSEFGRVFFITGTVLVALIVWAGYYRNIFLPKFIWIITIVFLGYLVSFLGYRMMTGHMVAHMAMAPSYALYAAFHGIVSLVAILLACFVFVFAARSFQKGENYFQIHQKTSIAIVVLWPLALLSGFLI